MLLRNISIVVGVFLIATACLGQKFNETNAAIQSNQALAALVQGDIEMAKQKYLEAKQFIDWAATNDETRNSQRTVWLQADIYSSILFLAMERKDMEFVKALGNYGIDEVIVSLKKAYAMGEKWRGTIINTAEKNRYRMNNVAQKAYAAEQYDQAAKAFMLQAAFADCIDVLDTVAIYNAANCYQKMRQLDKAAEQYARLEDPNNKQLYLDKGLVMFELGKNEEGEKAMKKALEIDPNDPNGQYLLAANLINWANKLDTEANNLGPNESSKFSEINKKRQDIYKRALVLLEKYILINPKDKSVLTTLYQIYLNNSNTDKAMEFKRRADAAE